MRKYKSEGAYEHLKKFTQGQTVTREDFEEFIDKIEDIPKEEKEKLKKLKPSTYIGLASELAMKALE